MPSGSRGSLEQHSWWRRGARGSSRLRDGAGRVWGTVQPVSRWQTRPTSGSTVCEPVLGRSCSGAPGNRRMSQDRGRPLPLSPRPPPLPCAPGHPEGVPIEGVRGGPFTEVCGGACACHMRGPLPTPPLTLLLNSQREHPTTI